MQPRRQGAENPGCFEHECVSAGELPGPSLTEPLLLSAWAVGALLFFQAGYDPWLSHSGRQREHLCYALTISGVVTIIRYFIYGKVL